MVPALKKMLGDLYIKDQERAGDRPMPEFAIRSVRVGDKPPTGWSTAKRNIDLLAAKVRAKDQDVDIDGMTDAEILERFKIPNWRFHDIRRVVATYVREAGASREGAKWMLGHADRSVTSIYLGAYLKQRFMGAPPAPQPRPDLEEMETWVKRSEKGLKPTAPSPEDRAKNGERRRPE